MPSSESISRNRQGELGDFLRSRRERLRPEEFGFAAGRRRRIAGLRREEVAQLAGIGVDWYIRLEQGRAVSPSTTTVDALARALRLSPVEHLHLRSLARTPERGAFQRESVPPTILRIVKSLNQPAYVTGRRWDVLAWNEAADDIFGFNGKLEADRNTLVSVLTDPKTRRAFGAGWETVAQQMVGQFRATYDLWASDPAFEELLSRLRADCPEFDAWWAVHEVRSAPAGRKTMRHPSKGELCLEYASFQSNDDAALRLIIYSAIERPHSD